MILIHLWIICSPVSGTCLAEQSKPCANLAQTLRCLAVLLHLVGGPLLKENVKHANGTQMSRWSFFACYTFLESAHILYNNNISKINISIIGHLWGHVKTAVKLIHLCCSISRHVGPLFKAFKDMVAQVSCLSVSVIFPKLRRYSSGGCAGSWGSPLANRMAKGSEVVQQANRCGPRSSEDLSPIATLTILTDHSHLQLISVRNNNLCKHPLHLDLWQHHISPVPRPSGWCQVV